MDDLFSIGGKTALVTGGTSGIGLAIARGFAEAGAKTYIVSRNAENCAEVARELSEHGVCIGLPGDLSTLKGIEAVLAAFRERESNLDILVNNAGAMADNPFAEFTEDDWDSVMDLNLKSPFFLIQKCLPLLAEGATLDDPARVINIGSMGALQIGPKENYSYQAAKSALHYLTRSLGRRLGPRHITVNTIAPGFFTSRMTQITDDMKAAILRQVPLGRIGKPEDIAGAAIFLASSAGSFVTGAVLPLEGGMSA
jgi:NAD(P)-dependent dehydrogenase (short-subunit alcohol dehydrogenase family)